MKKLISIAAALGLAVNSFATGAVGVNPSQSGVLNYSAATTLIQTNAFAYPFQVAPAVIVNGLITNNAPFTVSAITTSNFVLTVTTLATTNASVAWQAFAPYPRLQYGSQAVLQATPTNIAFAVNYTVAPNVVITANTTNSTAAATAVTVSNFTATVNANTTVNWQAIGQAYAPGTAGTLTY